MTQRQFAEKLYVTDSAVSKWERGLSYPDITLLHDICRVLEVSEHELLTASEDTEARRSETLARRYIRLVRGWKFGQIACYALAAVISFIADLASDGALGWAWVVLASLLTAASLTLTPALAPERMGGVWTAGAFTLALELLLGVCCLYTGGDWFFVAGISVLFGLCLVLLPFVLRRLPLPEALASRKTLLCLGADLALLLALLGVCCVYAGGDWFWITAVSVIFAAAVLLLPFVMKQLPLPEAFRRHSAALWLGTVSLLLFVLLGAACLYDGGDWFLLPALPMAVYGLLLPWGVLVLARYLRAGGWFRAAAALHGPAVQPAAALRLRSRALGRRGHSLERDDAHPGSADTHRPCACRRGHAQAQKIKKTAGPVWGRPFFVACCQSLSSPSSSGSSSSSSMPSNSRVSPQLGHSMEPRFRTSSSMVMVFSQAGQVTS